MLMWQFQGAAVTTKLAQTLEAPDFRCPRLVPKIKVLRVSGSRWAEAKEHFTHVQAFNLPSVKVFAGLIRECRVH